MIHPLTDSEIFTIGFMFSFGFYVAKDLYSLIKHFLMSFL